MATQGKPSYGYVFIVVDSHRELSTCLVSPHGIDFVCTHCIEPLDVAFFSCSPVTEQTVHQRSGHEDSQATVDLNQFLPEPKTRDCIQKTHQLAEEQKSANGGLSQRLPLEKNEGVKSHCCAPAAATTLDSEFLRERLS